MNNPENTVADFDILRAPDLRAEYLTLTDDLIRKMVDQGTEVAIFLDKSARPVAWMVQALWEDLKPHTEDGREMPMPQIKFLNIDREQWGAVVGRSEDEGIDISLLPQRRVDELRGVFKAPAPSAPDSTILSNKKVMVIDEVRVSGDTLEMSTQILQRAFPDAKEVKGTFWMDGKVKVDPKSGVKTSTQVPVWYKRDNFYGRLVGNRDSTQSSFSASQAQRLGRYWLSTAFKDSQDQRGLRLKEEIVDMAAEMRNHDLPYMPGMWTEREGEPDYERIERLNQISLKQYVELKRQNPDLKSFVEAFRGLNKAS